jgi:hypothetical protein
MAVTTALVDIEILNNGTWIDAFQFGTVGDTSWSFTGQNFRLDIKGNRDQAVPLLSLLSTGGTPQIIVDDAVQRILHVNVTDTVITTNLPPGEYVYDFVMFDGQTPPVRVPLMAGRIRVDQGITGN